MVDTNRSISLDPEKRPRDLRPLAHCLRGKLSAGGHVSGVQHGFDVRRLGEKPFMAIFDMRSPDKKEVDAALTEANRYVVDTLSGRSVPVRRFLPYRLHSLTDRLFNFPPRLSSAHRPVHRFSEHRIWHPHFGTPPPPRRPHVEPTALCVRRARKVQGRGGPEAAAERGRESSAARPVSQAAVPAQQALRRART